ncbi:MAG: hypothetical protein PHT89_04670 [Lachnospiraceae bacterium]|nr:hypothetical protein [Lachnospiraceae bacterium]MDD3659998.1 hypothetical protein [Lachnospiraceae bacterium]
MKNESKIIPRILITLLGIAMMLIPISDIILKVAGESATAVITEIRREGGERSDGIPGRYTYNISYTFYLPDGKQVDGFTKKIGNSVYLKADGTSTTKVRYLEKAPFINAMEKDTGLGMGQIVMFLTGGGLIFLINKRR